MPDEMMTERRERRRARTRAFERADGLFFPLALITVGVLLLLANMGRLPDPNWSVFIRFWPLFLLSAGISVLARGAGRLIGPALIVLNHVVFLAIWVTLIFFAPLIPALAPFVEPSAVSVNSDLFEYRGAEAENLTVQIDVSQFDLTVDALRDNPNVIVADVDYFGDVIWNAAMDGRTAEISLSARSDPDDWLAFLNPNSWVGRDDDGELGWMVDLTRDLPIDLDVETNSQDVTLHLDELTLSALKVDVNSGDVDLSLPAGDFDTDLRLNSGDIDLSLPVSGPADITARLNSGELTIYLPEDLAMAVIVEDNNSGDVDLSDRFEARERAEDGAEGEYRTDRYEEGASNSITLTVRLNSASLRVREP